jgi:nucleotide-binding universal stress UspA family protein
MIKKLARNSVDIEPELITCTSYNDILNEANNNNIDTVIVAASQQNSAVAQLKKPIELFLMGKCPTPLLIVKDHNWEPGGHILSAIELFNDNPEHQMLTKKVLEESEHFIQLLKGECHTVDCYFGESVDVSFNAIPSEKNQDIHLSKMKQHCHDYHLPYENVHLSLELPENAISTLAAEIDSELVILGDCGHRGLFSKLSTHVSEEVLNKVNCDLLVLKP